MIRLSMIAATLLVMTASPVLADAFFLVKDSSTNECKIVKEKPEDTAHVLVSETSFATKDEAKAAKKAAEECKK